MNFYRSLTHALGLPILCLTILASQSTHAQNFRDTSEYNLMNGVGLKGFDPVAVFPEGGGLAAPGKIEFALAYKDVTYLFASEQNRETFSKNPERYEPSYGGWCAYAMASGSKVDIQTDLYTIHGNRAHYFVSRRAKQNFEADIPGYESRADKNWKQISGEDPRL